MFNARSSALIVTIAAAAATRLIPHPPNMTAITALALFSGAYIGDRRVAFAMPLIALLLSDIALGLYYHFSIMAYQSHMEIQYLAFALIVVLGLALRRRRTALRVVTMTLSASIVFFLVTNFGEWLVQGLYPKTTAGLLACYVAAIPFFRNAIVGDLLFAAVLFGGFRLLEQRFTVFKEPGLTFAP